MTKPVVNRSNPPDPSIVAEVLSQPVKDPPIDLPINILIVDDEPKNLIVLETVLDDPGYRFVRAESADQALLALVVEEFALLILDIRMPGMSGLELAKMIKERKKTARVPIIFLTAYYNEDQHVLAGYDTGAVDYLHKPVNPEILRSKVAVFAELHRKNREVEIANSLLLAEVTERRRAEEQLRELNETLEQRVAERTEALREADSRKDEFLATLAHELRNPLAPIRNAVQILRLTGGDVSAVQSTSAIMDRQVNQLAHLVDDLLDVSRISRGKIELRRERIQLASIVNQAAETAGTQYTSLGHELIVTLPPQPIYLNADPIRLNQIVGNLLNNAGKFTDKGGRIELVASIERCEAAGENNSAHPFAGTIPFAVISIRDSGIGISPDQLTRIFDMFVQVDTSLERSASGLGIGLTLVKKLVELHGGTVEVRSAGIGHGSEFVVRLPILDDAPKLRTAGTTDGEFPAAELRRILVVDDNVDAATTLSRLLRLSGHETYTVHDGVQALEAAVAFKPHVVLLDIGLPKLNGYEVARKIRGEPWGRSLVLIALTGWGQDEDRRKSSAAGFNAHIVKPVDYAALTKLLAELLASAG